MAMNKKEQAEFAAMKKAVMVARALNWSEPVLADIAPPSFGGLTTGWLIRAHSGTVEVGCSSGSTHGRGAVNKTTSQGPIWLYSKKLMALKAVRHAVEKECAEKLASIDMQIQAEKDFQP